ncbi:MAG: glycosyltransferase family 2 protein [Planctomycetes bacterium]|nr:glycosyltransferase family 2 protein [Planctomycetota bacterium]MBU4397963.1 glycosyltransferase family 2 protein [Planctomycetota bacterium]MCG2684017.1 glycosyltransferase family 2 protein [Planctomycetales bacterium]
MTPAESLSCRRSDARDSAKITETLFITVIMPVRNEVKWIERTLTQLVTQKYDPERFEIIVVDGQSTDGTPERVAKFVERHPNVRLYANPRRLGSAARNVALRHARGDVVVIVDGHCELEDNRYLAKLASAFDRSGADCIGRPQPLDIPGATALQRAIAAARSSWLGHHPDSYIYSSEEGFVPAKSVAVAYRRSVFEQVGTFDERFDACEDVEMNHRIDRAGLRCFFTPEAVVHYTPRTTLGGLFRQLVRYGRGRVRLARKHPETFSVKSFLPALFLLGCLAGLVLMWVSSWLAVAYLSASMIYGSILVATSAVAAVRKGELSILLWLPLVFVVVHTGSGAGEILELFRGPSRHLCRQAVQTQT